MKLKLPHTILLVALCIFSPLSVANCQALDKILSSPLTDTDETLKDSNQIDSNQIDPKNSASLMPPPNLDPDPSKNVINFEDNNPKNPTNPSPNGTKLEPLLWQIQMAEMSFKIKEDEKTAGELVTAYIKLVERTCLEPHFKYNNTGKPLAINPDEACKSALSELIKLAPQSATAICARDGLLSSNCKEAELKQQTVLINDSSYASNSQNADFLEPVDNSAKIIAISKDLTNFRSKYRPAKDLTTEEKEKQDFELKKIINRLLRLACGNDTYSYKIKSPTPTPTPSFLSLRPTPTRSPYNSNPYPLNKKTPTVATKVKFDFDNHELIRLRPKECGAQLNLVAQVAPQSTDYNCYFYGKYSSNCLNATLSEYKQSSELKTNSKSSVKSQSSEPNKKIFKSF